MTITVKFRTICTAIAGLSIPGVNVRDVNQIPENAMPILPVLFPSPDNFITEFTPQRVTAGGHGTAAIDLNYTLNFCFLHSVIGSGGGLFSTYPDFIDKLALIIIAFLTNDDVNGGVDLQVSVSNIGPMTDPAQAGQYHGADIALRILEFAQ